MTCWNGHMPHMTDDQLHQAVHAYTRAQYAANWHQAWASPMNPLRDAHNEPPVSAEPRKTTSLETARQGDKVDAIDVAFTRVR
jgi:hypothetical protein